MSNGYRSRKGHKLFLIFSEHLFVQVNTWRMLYHPHWHLSSQVRRLPQDRFLAKAEQMRNRYLDRFNGMKSQITERE
jgi:hypothetical protein